MVVYGLTHEVDRGDQVNEFPVVQDHPAGPECVVADLEPCPGGPAADTQQVSKLRVQRVEVLGLDGVDYDPGLFGRPYVGPAS